MHCIESRMGFVTKVTSLSAGTECCGTSICQARQWADAKVSCVAHCITSCTFIMRNIGTLTGGQKRLVDRAAPGTVRLVCFENGYLKGFRVDGKLENSI